MDRISQKVAAMATSGRDLTIAMEADLPVLGTGQREFGEGRVQFLQYSWKMTTVLET